MKTLFDLVKNISGETTATITYLADCGFPQKSGLADVSKRVSQKVAINHNYVEDVRSRIAEKGGNPNDFVEESLRWGAWEKDMTNKVIAHKGEYYLRYYCIESEYPSVEYFVNGVPATAQQEADIKAYLATKTKESAKQGACGLSVKEQVMPRNVKFSNIESVVFESGEVWIKGQSAAA